MIKSVIRLRQGRSSPRKCTDLQRDENESVGEMGDTGRGVGSLQEWYVHPSEPGLGMAGTESGSSSPPRSSDSSGGFGERG